MNLADFRSILGHHRQSGKLLSQKLSSSARFPLYTRPDRESNRLKSSIALDECAI